MWSDLQVSFLRYRKIPKISLSIYKPPQTRNAKNPLLNRLSKYKPPGTCTWKIALKYRVKHSKKNVNLLPTIRLTQSISKRKFPSVDKPLRIYRGYYTVARRYEFYFRVAKQYFTNKRSEWVKYCFCHEKIKFISSRRRVMFFLLYQQKDIDNIIDF